MAMQIESDLLRKDLRQKMNDVTDTVATGGCQDFGDYKHLTGVIEGLAIAERMLLDRVEAAKKLEGDSE